MVVKFFCADKVVAPVSEYTVHVIGQVNTRGVVSLRAKIQNGIGSSLSCT